MVLEIFQVVAPLFIMAGIGYLLEKSGLELPTESLGRLIVLVGTPALVFSTLTSPELPAISLPTVFSAALVTVLIAGGLSALILMAMRQPFRAFVPSLALPNSGNAGLPVLLLAFGDEGLAVGIAVFFVVAIFQYTVVPVMMADKFSIRHLLSQPLLYAVLAVGLFRLTETAPHPIIWETTDILGGMVIPVMVILLGYSLSQLTISDLRLSFVLAIARLVIGVASGLGAVALLGLQGVQAGGVFLMASMPCAIIIYVFALRYDRAPRRIAGLVVVSTLTTFAVLPVLVWIGIQLSIGGMPWLT